MSIVGKPGLVAYCSSKSALKGGIKALALELATRKIRVNSVLPAYVLTEMTKTILSASEEISSELLKQHPLGFGTAEDIANA